MLYTHNTDYVITLLIIIAIIYATTLYVITGILLTYFLDKCVFKSDNMVSNEKDIKELSLFYIIFTTVLIISCIYVFSFFGRMFVEKIPFPLEKYHNFKYMAVREVSSGIALTIIMFAFSEAIFRKYNQLKYKLDIN